MFSQPTRVLLLLVIAFFNVHGNMRALVKPVGFGWLNTLPYKGWKREETQRSKTVDLQG